MSRSNPLCRLRELGQSVWLDYIERGFIARGELAAAIKNDCVAGVTSNPAIFEKAISEYGQYDKEIHSLARTGWSVGDIYDAIVVEDIQAAADALSDVYQRSAGKDGFVSLEVSPHLAQDAERTFSEGRRLWSLVQRPNLMIKVPGTEHGLAAIRHLTAHGINVNVTLLFSVERYAAVAQAYMSGLEQRLRSNESISRISSVASFFLSRIDTIVDKRLSGHESLQGQAAIACARLAYRRYESLIDSDRWAALEAQGAHRQRLLWASTGTKSPAYSDTKYVEPLIGPDTVTTLPPETLEAYRHHGDPAARLNDDPERAQEIIAQLRSGGIDMEEIAAALEQEGIKKFVEPFDASHRALAERIRQSA